jgi:hypothetical protein
VPDTQIFKIDFTKSARYHKRKIKLVRRNSSSAWQDDAPANAETPKPLRKSPIVPDSQIFKLDFTKSAKFHKRKIKLMRRSSSSAGRDDVSAHNEGPTSLKRAVAIKELSDTSPMDATSPKATLIIPARNSSSAAAPEESSQPKKARSKKISRAATYRITDHDGSAQSGEMITPHDQSEDVTTPHDKDKNELHIVRTRTTTIAAKPTSLMEEGLNYRKLARAATKGRELVGTVHGDGTVETKRRWFCCGRRALGAAEERALAAAIPNQDEGIDKALADTIRDRVRRSQRNARFHRFRGVTPGVVHHGGGPDMDELRDGDVIEV